MDGRLSQALNAAQDEVAADPGQLGRGLLHPAVEPHGDHGQDSVHDVDAVELLYALLGPAHMADEAVQVLLPERRDETGGKAEVVVPADEGEVYVRVVAAQAQQLLEVAVRPALSVLPLY